MNNPAFLIDGFTEQKILNKLCPGSKITRIALNGRDVKIKAMASKIASLIRTFGGKYYPIIILVDREKREASFQEIRNELEKEIKNENIQDQLIIGVADQMIENWILADWDNFKEKAGTDNIKPDSTDGIGGKGAIKKYIENYHETIDGVNLFLSSDQKKIYDNSPSFKNFIDELTSQVNCHYINELKKE